MIPNFGLIMLCAIIAIGTGVLVELSNNKKKKRDHELVKACDYMKKASIALILFAVVFVAAYLAICFAIPGMRIKLEAEPMEYFLESIRHMAFIKTVASLIPALIAGTIPFLFRKR